MRVSRKIQQNFEAKIRHSIATGPLPHIERGPAHGSHAPQEAPKADEQDKSQEK